MTAFRDRAVRARLFGRCTACDEVIAQGDWIVSDDEGGWQHLACAEDDAEDGAR